MRRSRLAGAVARTMYDNIKFRFGLDEVTPAIDTAPGSLRSASNYEININGGYTGCLGYERYDGRVPPSAAQYHRVDCTITGTIGVGDTVTDATTGGSGVCIAVNATHDASQVFLILTKVSGSFDSGNDLQVSSVTQATADSDSVADGAPTPKLRAQYRAQAADNYRADIGPVPGSGKILGVWLYNDDLYAFRNNAGGTAAVMHKATGSGWDQVPLGKQLAFTSGSREILVGDTITGPLSTATAVVTGVALQEGGWQSGDAAGIITFASQTGTFVAEDINIGGDINVASISGDSSDIALLPGGRYEFRTFAFKGRFDAEKMYGCDGVNKAFEFDGTGFIPISSGIADDRPSHIETFQDHLFLSYDSSVIHSGIGTPHNFTALAGASEILVGSAVTNFVVQPGIQQNGALAIISRQNVNVLYGTSAANWSKAQYRRRVGAYKHSAQEFGITLMMDDRGIVNFETTDAFGNFKHGTASWMAQSFLSKRKTLVSASCVARDKSQYRLFFSDRTALYITLRDRTILGVMPQTLAHTVECMCSEEALSGEEEIYFGSDDGYVYQMERGTSFDGQEIERLLNLHYYHGRSPRVEKSYFDASFEVAGGGYAEFEFRYELGYNQPEITQPFPKNIDVNFSSESWDSGINWDSGHVWDGVVLTPSLAEIPGTAENISLIFYSRSDHFDPLTFSGAMIRYTLRKQLRT